MIPLKIAFPLLGRLGWAGGYNYLKNTLSIIQTRLSEQVEASVFLSPSEYTQYGIELSPLTNDRLIVDGCFADIGRGSSLVRAIATGNLPIFERVLAQHKIDVVFENANFYGAGSKIPVISWMPDFQHRHMPQLFSRVNRWRRDLGFRMQMSGRRIIMVSSNNARDDLTRFYGRNRDQCKVVRFAIALEPNIHWERGCEVRAAYGLHGNFIFMPNQFWQHKNHALVVDALIQLKLTRQLEAIPKIVMTGAQNDLRLPAHFGNLMQRAKNAGVEAHFCHLGIIPYLDVLALNAACDSLLNPSLFEGWSTTVEEAKSMGTSMLLSDIPIHREQAPNATFFDPHLPQSLADVLLAISSTPPAPRPTLSELHTAQESRLDEHALSLLNAIQAAAVLGQPLPN